MPRFRPRGLKLPHAVRARMERSFQADFSRIRVHEGPLAQRLGARAFACGDHLHFAPGCYQPDQPAGEWLLAHELAHVLQQRTGRVANPFGHGLVRVSDPCLEAEADDCAFRVLHGQPAIVPACAPSSTSRAVLLDEVSPDGPLVLQCDDDDDDDWSDLPMSKWQNIRSRHRTEKRVATSMMTAASLGIQAASISTGASALALIGGAAVSATGIGLIAGGAALTVGSSMLAMKSAYSTSQHLKNLEAIYNNRHSYPACRMLPPAEGQETSVNAQFTNLHGWIADKVLPWIIRQKKHKLGKKIGTSVGGGMLVGVWSAGRNLYKRAKGTLGKRRTYFAECLAVHLVTSNCKLAQAIVAELLSEDEMLGLRFRGSEEVSLRIADKIKSV